MSVVRTNHETIAITAVIVEAKDSCRNCFLASAYAFEVVDLGYSVD